MSRRRAANALLLVGYSLAGGAGLRFVPMWRERRGRRFAAFEAGTGLVVVGLVLRRRPIEATANAVTATALGVAWAAHLGQRT